MLCASDSCITHDLSRVKGNLAVTAQDLEEARKAIIKRVQQTVFSKEIVAIKNRKDISKQSRLLRLNPFLEGSRGFFKSSLKHSALPYETKHQLILPSHNRFTQLIVEHEHARLLHAGPQATLGAIRLRY